MDRLEPVLKQKFWILLGIGLILTITGWWMATSAIAKTMSERIASVDASFSSIPGGQIPNESWAKKLGTINTEQDSAIKGTQLGMWKRQRERMTWPDGITDPGYWGKFTNQQREQFRDTYEDEVHRVWKLVNPYNKNDGTGIVEYPLPQVFALLRQKSWDMAPPDSEVMWTVREDLWLLECLFHSITSVNGGFEVGRGDACIHQIDRLELRGGGDKSRDNASGGGSSSGTDALAFGGPPAAMMAAMRSGGGGGMGGITEGLKMVSAEFDPAEEFGDDGSSSGVGRGVGGGGAFGAAANKQAMMAMQMTEGGMGGFGGGGGGNTASSNVEIKRYLQIDSNLPFKKRGFYLSVKMDHTKIPLLIAELTANEKSVWPIEILRVQMSRLNEDDSTGGRFGKGTMPPGYPPPMGPFGPGGPDSDNLSAANQFGEFPTNLKTGNGPDLSNSRDAQAMRAALENALRDPVMAQVTICGAITLFKEVPEEKKLAPSTPAHETEDSDNKSATAEETPEKSENPTPDPLMEAAVEVAEPPETPAEMNDPNESTEKPESGEKPNPGEPKPGSGEK